MQKECRIITETKNNSKAAELRREYHRQWRKNHKDKVKEYNQKYWEKRAEKMQREQGAANNG